MDIIDAKKVDRQISIFNKIGRGFLVDGISLNDVSFSKLISLIPESEYGKDFLLFNCYLLNKFQLDKISEFRNKEIDYNLKKFEYYLEATSK